MTITAVLTGRLFHRALREREWVGIMSQRPRRSDADCHHIAICCAPEARKNPGDDPLYESRIFANRRGWYISVKSSSPNHYSSRAIRKPTLEISTYYCLKQPILVVHHRSAYR
ncbi:hypothetical protein AG1IA_08751 [Rhizoctonia solani AG-1 IA]|uniref:Uncharacterized protein n=1 Tax=Thanatephorus cucumeris (strain AG1-IA) TaxID=983506 RepID=L8WGA0_THACA|nr:hypothetical protein AG1IA_08751 [Rhizoctonia solani AG-1 IA]